MTGKSFIPGCFYLFQESSLETRFQNLATAVGPLYKQLAPDAYDNQVGNVLFGLNHKTVIQLNHINYLSENFMQLTEICK